MNPRYSQAYRSVEERMRRASDQPDDSTVGAAESSDRLGPAEQCEEFGWAQACLPEHCVEEGGRDIAAHLMARADLKNLAGGQHLFPGLVLS